MVGVRRLEGGQVDGRLCVVWPGEVVESCTEGEAVCAERGFGWRKIEKSESNKGLFWRSGESGVCARREDGEETQQC